MKKVVNFCLSLVGAAVFSFALILIFAFIVKIFPLNKIVVKSVNQVIKVVAVFFGVLLTKTEGKNLIFGLLFGFFYGLLTNLVFGCFGGVVFNLSLLIELVFCSVIGVVCASIKNILAK